MIRVMEEYLASGDPGVFGTFNLYVPDGKLPHVNEELRFKEQMLMVIGKLLQGRKPEYPGKEHEIVADFVVPSRHETTRLKELLTVMAHKKAGSGGSGDFATAYHQIMGGFFTLKPDLARHLDKSGLVKFTPGMVVADIGCGVGSQVTVLARRVGPKGRVYAVDISKRVVDFLGHLKTKVPGGERILPVRSRQDDTTLEQGSLDLAMVHGINFLFGGKGETMPQHAIGFFRSVHRALKPGGLFLIRSYQQTGELEQYVAGLGFEKVGSYNAMSRTVKNTNTMIREDLFVLFKATPPR